MCRQRRPGRDGRARRMDSASGAPRSDPAVRPLVMGNAIVQSPFSVVRFDAIARNDLNLRVIRS
jgi:hypothetical protein